MQAARREGTAVANPSRVGGGSQPPPAPTMHQEPHQRWRTAATVIRTQQDDWENPISVWAPHAEQVELQTAQERMPMRAAQGGWWVSDQPPASAAAGYAFRLNAGRPLPDPRSPWQPQGVHGPSRPVRHGDFIWSDSHFQPPPLASAVLYELHIGTFTRAGTFQAAIERLDHLRDLGVTHIELLPVAEFPGDFGWGYDGVCPFAVREAYGGPTGLKQFVAACHARQLAVLLDVVYNHLGPSGNYLNEFGPYFSSRHHTPWGPAINFDGAGSDPVRRYFCDNALMWLRDYHFDGLRLDAVHAIVDTSALPFLEQLSLEVEQLSAHTGRHYVLVAESDLNDPRTVRSRDAGGWGLHAQWADDFHHALHSVLTGETSGYYSDFGPLQMLAQAFTTPFLFAGNHSQFRERVHGRPPLGCASGLASGATGHRFVVCAQNHDQIGNRARGERLNHLLRPPQARIAAALVLLSPYVPLLFQGEEWSASAPFAYFADWRDEPQLADAVRSGRRAEFAAFGWQPEDIPDPTAVETFARSQLDWSELDQPAAADMLAWYRQLIQLRRRWPQLTCGDLEAVQVDCDEQARWLCVARDPLWLMVNFSDSAQTVPLPPSDPARVPILLASSPVEWESPTQIRLPPESVTLLALSRAGFRSQQPSPNHA
jgi:maltooligosyltrehalose trehalohydrolase